MSSKESNQYDLVGPFTATHIRAFGTKGAIGRLSLTKQKLLTAKIAKGFQSLQSVQSMWLWCSVTRTAMREVIAIPGLQTLDVLEIRHPGALQGFGAAKTLKQFRANHYMSESDLLEVASLPALEELGAQNSTLSCGVLEALLKMPRLCKLNLVASNFDDQMAEMVADNLTLEALALGATKLSKKGLQQICKMQKLRSLDIWANDLTVEDLGSLSKLENLEYLAIGGYEDQTTMTANAVLPLLEKLPSLKQLWLDGIVLTEQEESSLKQRYEYFQN